MDRNDSPRFAVNFPQHLVGGQEQVALAARRESDRNVGRIVVATAQVLEPVHEVAREDPRIGAVALPVIADLHILAASRVRIICWKEVYSAKHVLPWTVDTLDGLGGPIRRHA